MIAALLLVLTLDHTLLGKSGPWSNIASRITPFGGLHWGVGQERALLKRLGQRPSEVSSVVVMGTSRAFAGFDPALAEELVPRARFATMARPNLDPVSVRFLAPEVADARTNLVVLMLSEFDTHRPLRLEPIPDKSVADLRALGQLIAITDTAFFVQNRESLYRIAASSISRAYRFRGLLGIGYLNRLRDFPLSDRLAEPSLPRIRGKTALGRATPTLLSPERAQPLIRQLSKRFRNNEMHLAWIAEIHNGPHVTVQMRLVRNTVAYLHERGIEVLLVETPLHKISLKITPTNARGDFVAMAVELAQLPGVEFISLNQMPRFRPADFSDLLHLNDLGKQKLTTAIAKEIHSKLLAPNP